MAKWKLPWNRNKEDKIKEAPAEKGKAEQIKEVSATLTPPAKDEAIKAAAEKAPQELIRKNEEKLPDFNMDIFRDDGRSLEHLSRDLGEMSMEKKPTINAAVTRDGTIVSEKGKPGDDKLPASRTRAESRKISVKAAVRQQTSYIEQERKAKEQRQSEKDWTKYEEEKEATRREVVRAIKPLVRDVGGLIASVNMLKHPELAAMQAGTKSGPIVGGFKTPRPTKDDGPEMMYPGQRKPWG